MITDNLKLAILSIAATIALSIGGMTVNIVATLSDSIDSLDKTVAVLSHRVDELPPKELTLKLDHLDSELVDQKLEQQRLQVQIDTLEQWIRDSHPTTRKPKPNGYVRD